jgi:S1-C subfamily serine protease
MIALVGVAAVAILTVGLVRFISNEVEPQRTQIVSGSGDDRREDSRVVDSIDDDYPDDEYVETGELTLLTAREVYDNNVNAVFTVFIRIPEEWNLTEFEVAMYYRYYLTLPTGIYIPHGSGFFANADGVAITNHHVVREFEHMIARTHDGGIHPIVGYYSYDINNDIAIIQVEGSGFSYTSFSEIPVGVGDYAFAIGSSDGDPNTFTSGVVSRIAEEIRFDIYTVTDVIQFTAPIYGGNSGGPIFNHYGQVIGVVSAGHVERASVGFAVRIERVDLGGALNASITSFPLGDGIMAIVNTRDYYESFPTVPTLQSVNDDVLFIIGGNAADMELDEIGYERAYTYNTFGADGLSIISQYESALLQRGFRWQNDVESSEIDMWVFYYHQEDDISVSIIYISEYGMLLIAIGSGNSYENIYYMM